MNQIISQFLVTRCHMHATARCPFKQFVNAFRLTLPAELRRQWPRTRVLAELSKSFSIEMDRHSQRFNVLGLALLPQASHLIAG